MLTNLLNRDGIYLNQGASEYDLSLTRAAAERLSVVLPEDYIGFLQLSNGMQIENAYFEGTDSLIDYNLDTGYQGTIAVGHNGNVVEYVFDSAQNRYCAVSFGHPDEVIASFSNFEGLAAYVISEQGLA